MDYRQAVKFHEETKVYGSVLGLGSIRALMGKLGDVWRKLRVVHVAGTNGKGSVCCFLGAVLKEAGYRVGQYSSPAVFGVRDAYRMDGKWISEEDYAFCMGDVADVCRMMMEDGMRHPTVFEVETALAFLWFFRKKCDVVLLEVGMGGSTDATNIVEKPLCSVFTSIGMDHMAFLGDSLQKIAEVKAGIIKLGCPVVSDVQRVEVEGILRKYADMCHSSFCEPVQMEKVWAAQGKLICRHPYLGELRLAMAGSYQAGNAALAIGVVEVLQKEGFFVTEGQLVKGLEGAVWPGRFERILEKPLFYIDGAHNLDGARMLDESLKMHFGDLKKIGIMGVMADKPYGEMLDVLLPSFDRIFVVTPPNTRALPARELGEEIRLRGGNASVQESIAAACMKAVEAGEDAVIVAFGSLFFLDEVKGEIVNNMRGGGLR